VVELLLRLYPGWWRRRYGAEALDSLKSHRLTALSMWDLAVGAADAWLSQRMPVSGADEGETLTRVRVFGPLDPNERLPRESPPDARLGLQLYRGDVEHRSLSRRELVAALLLPALLLVLIVLGSGKADVPLAVGVGAAVLLGVVAFAFFRRRKGPSRRGG
jgi:hypothetical protein